MVLASLDDPSFAQTVARSELSSIISNRLENLFNAIPAHVDYLEIYSVDVTWGLDSPLWTKEKKFPGCRQVAAFFMWLDYCDQLIKEAQMELAETLARTIRVMFFERIVTPALADHHVVLITALVTKCLKEMTSSILCTGMCNIFELSHDTNRMRGSKINFYIFSTRHLKDNLQYNS